MESRFFLLCCVMLINSLSAQTITQSFNEPSINDVDINYKLDTSLYTNGLPLANTGTNLTWDFGLVQGMFPVMYDSILSTSAIASGSLYANASYGYKQYDVISYFQSNTSAQQTALSGIYSPSLAFTFTNAGVVANYPMSYGYNNVDVVSGSYTLGAGSSTGACNGSITVTADATGTLVFPFNVVFNNVLRLTSVQQLTLSSGLFPLGTITQNMYRFYVPQRKYPILTVRYQKYQLLAGTPTITAIAYGNSNYFTVASIPENRYELTNGLSPNPFSNSVSIAGNNLTEECSIIIRNVEGRIVVASDNCDSINTDALVPGIYFAEIIKPGVRYRQKLIKE